MKGGREKILDLSYTEAEFMNVDFRLGFWGIILRVLRLEFTYTMFTLQTSFKPLLLKRGWEEVKSVSRGDSE